MTKSDRSKFVIHKLKGKCRYKRKGNFKICEICKHKKEIPLKLNTFTSGGGVNVGQMNNNFEKLEERMNRLGNYLSDIEKKLDVVQDIMKK